MCYLAKKITNSINYCKTSMQVQYLQGLDFFPILMRTSFQYQYVYKIIVD